MRIAAGSSGFLMLTRSPTGRTRRVDGAASRALGWGTRGHACLPWPEEARRGSSARRIITLFLIDVIKDSFDIDQQIWKRRCELKHGRAIKPRELDEENGAFRCHT